MSGKSRRDVIIDVARIIAMLMILSVHIHGALAERPTVVSKVFSLCAYGVALYFLISGYLSCGSVKDIGFGTYFRKKAMRIAPKYYVSLVITFIVGAVILKIYPISWEWIYSVFFMQMVVPAEVMTWWNCVNYFWTMTVFVEWYIIAFFVLKHMKGLRGVAVIALGTLGCTPLVKVLMYKVLPVWFVNWNILSVLYVFLLGVMLYYVIKEEQFKAGALYCVAAVVIGLVTRNRSGYFVFSVFFYIVILAANVLVRRFGMLEKLYLGGDVTSFRIVGDLANATYSVYLTHWFVVTLLKDKLDVFPWFIGWLLFVVTAFLVGYAFDRIVDGVVRKIKAGM